MLIKDEQTSLDLVVEETSPSGVQGLEDLGLRSVLATRSGTGNVRVCKFTASVISWIDIAKFKNFVKQLETFESSRQGSAEIESMSPGEFRIRFYIDSGSGGIIAEGEVGQHLLLSERMNKVFFDIHLNPAMLKAIIEDFKHLVVEKK